MNSWLFGWVPLYTPFQFTFARFSLLLLSLALIILVSIFICAVCVCVFRGELSSQQSLNLLRKRTFYARLHNGSDFVVGVWVVRCTLIDAVMIRSAIS